MHTTQQTDWNAWKTLNSLLPLALPQPSRHGGRAIALTVTALQIRPAALALQNVNVCRELLHWAAEF
jgi:hypothetical protein